MLLSQRNFMLEIDNNLSSDEVNEHIFDTNLLKPINPLSDGESTNLIKRSINLKFDKAKGYIEESDKQRAIFMKYLLNQEIVSDY